MEECLHEELYFASGDYYVYCANPACRRCWVTMNAEHQPTPELANKGKQTYLSGERRVKNG